MGEYKHEARRIFTAALALGTPEERARYLDEACQARSELRQRVEALLRAHEQAGGFLEQTMPVPPPASDFEIEGAGVMIGRYKLLEKIGEGGFGVVYMAEQTQPVRRKVALKIIKAGMDTKEVIARFEAERQALALMEHPNIAQVFDGGVTQAGRPYFVMELVKGVPVTEYCDHHNLPMADRLQLFMQVCHAAQHAHQKGIIHRDIKPGNILITMIDAKPVPKIIDFGVAKALGRQLTERTLFTAFQQIVGTPLYMSPEQTAISGVDVDTRSDIYSLGVLLYELLTGSTPIDAETVRKAGLDEVRRMIRETDPPRPSTRLRTLGDELTHVARHRNAEPSSLTRMIHGDLDWIVMKALEKDRGRRYETVNALLADIQRHLDHQPVMAGPPDIAYRTKKYVRRHRMGVALAASVTLALIAGLVAALVGFAQARQDRDRALAAEEQSRQERDRALEAEAKAERETAIAEAVNQFLQRDLLKQASPSYEPDRDIKLRTLLDRAAENVGARFHDKPLVEAEIRLTLYSTYLGLGEYPSARVHLDRALELYKGQLPLDDPRLLRAQRHAVDLLISEGRYRESQTLLERLLATHRQVFGPDNTNTLVTMASLADACWLNGELERSRQMTEEVYSIRLRTLGAKHKDTLESMMQLGNAYASLTNDMDVQKLEEAYSIQLQKLGPHHRATLSAMWLVAAAYAAQGKPSEAQELWQRIIAGYQQLDGAEDLNVLIAKGNLANVYTAQGKLVEAQQLQEQVLSALRRVAGPEHPRTLHLMSNLAVTYRRQGRLGEAQRTEEQILALKRGVLGPEHPETLNTIMRLAYIYRQQDKPAEAENLAEQVLSARRRVLGNAHPNTLRTVLDLSQIKLNRREFAEAQELLEPSLPDIRRVFGVDHPVTRSALTMLATTFQRQGQLIQARKLFEEVLEVQRRTLGPRHDDTTGTIRTLATVCGSMGDWSPALKYAQELRIAEPQDHWLWYQAHAVAVVAGEVEVASELCQGMQSRFGDTQDPAICERVARSLLLSLDCPDNFECAAELARRAFNKNPEWPWVRSSMGMAEYRLGHYAVAAELLEPPFNDPNPKLGCLSGYFLAMSLHLHGDTKAAQRVLKEANDRFAADFHSGNLGEFWHDSCRNLVARSEAERLILGREASPPVTSDSLTMARKRWNPVLAGLNQGFSTARHQQWSEARDAYLRAWAEPAFHWQMAEAASEIECLSLQMAVSFYQAKDFPNLDRLCQLLLAQRTNHLSTLAAERYAKSCFLNWPRLAPANREEAVELARYAMAHQGPEDHGAFCWNRNTGGMAEYYAGQWERAIELSRLAEGLDEVGCKGGALIYEAMALHRLNRGTEALEALQAAEQLLTQPLEQRAGGRWWDLDICQIALDEARQLITGDRPALETTSGAMSTLLTKAKSLAKQREWLRARDAFARVLADPDFNWQAAERADECLSMKMAVCFRIVGDDANHGRLCRLLLAIPSEAKPPHLAERHAKSCFLNWRVLTSELQQSALELARYSMDHTQPGSSLFYWNRHVGAMAEFHAGHWEQAIALCQVAEESGDVACKGAAMICRAMALNHLGRTTEAFRLVEAAEDLLGEPLERRTEGAWWDLDICQVVLDEARDEMAVELSTVPPQWQAMREHLDDAVRLAEKQEWSQACVAYAAALGEPDFDWQIAETFSPAQCLSLQMAVAFRHARDNVNLDRLCDLLLDMPTNHLSPILAERYARSRLLNWERLSPESRQSALELARYAVTHQGPENHTFFCWNRLTGGMAEFCSGQWERSIELSKLAEELDNVGCKGAAMIYRAMALKKWGRHAEATEVLQEAEALLAEPLRTRTGGLWWDLDFCQLALDEAHQLIGGSSKP